MGRPSRDVLSTEAVPAVRRATVRRSLGTAGLSYYLLDGRWSPALGGPSADLQRLPQAGKYALPGVSGTAGEGQVLKGMGGRYWYLGKR